MKLSQAKQTGVYVSCYQCYLRKIYGLIEEVCLDNRFREQYLQGCGWLGFLLSISIWGLGSLYAEIYLRRGPSAYIHVREGFGKVFIRVSPSQNGYMECSIPQKIGYMGHSFLLQAAWSCRLLLEIC